MNRKCDSISFLAHSRGLPLTALQLQQTTVENSTAHFEVKEFINRFKNVNTRKFELSFGEDNPASDGSQKFYWIWHRDGRLWSEGLDYSFRVVTILDSATENTANWRFYCETKKDNFTSHYYWPKTDPRVQLSVRRGKGGREGGREGGRGANKIIQCEAKTSNLTSYYFWNRRDKHKLVRYQVPREKREKLKGRKTPVLLLPPPPPPPPLPPSPHPLPHPPLPPFPNPSPRFLFFPPPRSPSEICALFCLTVAASLPPFL